MSVFNMPAAGLGRSRPEMTLDSIATKASLRLLIVDGLKRSADAFLAGLALVFLSPFIAAVALLLKIDGGSIFLRQRRVGRDGAEFLAYTFRSTVVDVDRRRDGLVTRDTNGQLGVRFKVDKGARLTKLGRFLRETKLDEMPTFWNILRGEMSFFGA